MLRDRILAGTIAGMIATLVKAVPNLLLFKFNVISHTYFQIAASALLLPRDIYNSTGTLIGIVVDIITGGSLGVLIIYLLKYTGRDYLFFKGWIFGNLVWLWGLGIMLNFGAARIVPVEPVFRLVSMVDHQLFGIITVYLINLWYPVKET